MVTSCRKRAFSAASQPAGPSVCQDPGMSSEARRRRGLHNQLHSQLHSHDTSLFPGLVLGWINADFRVQIRILQHFYKIYKTIIFSQEDLKKKESNCQNLQNLLARRWFSWRA